MDIRAFAINGRRASSQVIMVNTLKINKRARYNVAAESAMYLFVDLRVARTSIAI